MRRFFSPRRTILFLSAIQALGMLVLISYAVPILLLFPTPGVSKQRHDEQIRFRKAILGTGVIVPVAFSLCSTAIFWVAYREIRENNGNPPSAVRDS